LGGNPVFGDYNDDNAHGVSLVIGANVVVIEKSSWSFGDAYNRNGRKAGRYTSVVNTGAGSVNWTYSAR
jgi:hypothetical protein